VGIVFSYLFNSVIVFKVKASIKGLITYPVVYLIQYLTTAVFLALFVESGLASETIAPLLAIGLTIPITYLAAKFFIVRR
jgi:putative flippase GtrA